VIVNVVAARREMSVPFSVRTGIKELEKKIVFTKTILNWNVIVPFAHVH